MDDNHCLVDTNSSDAKLIVILREQIDEMTEHMHKIEEEKKLLIGSLGLFVP